MPAQGHNEGFHVLDEFVCTAILSPPVLRANPDKPGVSEGLSVVEELVLEAGLQRPVALDVALKSEAERLAVVISKSTDPVGTTALFQKLLLDELDIIRRESNR